MFQPLIRRVLAVIAVVPLLLGACGASPSQSPAGSGEPAGPAGSSGAQPSQLVVAVPNTPNTVDAEFGASSVSWEAPVSICEFLVSYQYKTDASGVGAPDLLAPFEPRLAESWEFTNDGKTIVFHLRQGVKSEFGNELTTADVKWSWDRAYALNAIGLWMFQSAQVTGQDGIKVVDPYTMSVDLTAPSQLLLANQAIPQIAPCITDSSEAKKHATADDPWAKAWLGTHTATFGPYRVTEFTPGQQVVLETNPNYYRQKPAIGKVIYKVVPDAAQRLLLLTTGTVQMAEDLGTRERQQLKGQPGVNVVDVPGNFGIILGLNNKIAPFDNKLVRQAIAVAAPIDDIIKTVYLGDPSVRLFKGYTPDSYPGHTDYWPYYPTDLDKAKALLEQAGQGPFEMTLSYSTDQQDAQQVAVLLQTQLAKIGITVVLDAEPAAKYQETFFGRKAQTVLVEDALWNGDPGYGLNLYFTPESHADWINYENPEVTKLIQQVRATLDPKGEADLAKQAYEKIVDDAPWAFQIGTGYHVAMSDKLTGFNWRMSNLIDFSTLSFK